MKTLEKNYFVRVFKKTSSSMGQDTATSLEAAIERAESYFKEDVNETIELIELIKIEGLVLKCCLRKVDGVIQNDPRHTLRTGREF